MSYFRKKIREDVERLRKRIYEEACISRTPAEAHMRSLTARETDVEDLKKQYMEALKLLMTYETPLPLKIDPMTRDDGRGEYWEELIKWRDQPIVAIVDPSDIEYFKALIEQLHGGH